jgi:hypothetical protein
MTFVETLHEKSMTGTGTYKAMIHDSSLMKAPPFSYTQNQWEKVGIVVPLPADALCIYWIIVKILLALVNTHKYTVGWVDFFKIFNKSTPEICHIPSKRTENSQKKNVSDPVTASSLVMTFWVMHFIRAQILYSQYGLHGYQKTQNFM